MTSKRAEARAEARLRWMRERADTNERTRRVKERIATVLGKAKYALADREFIELLRLRRVRSIPQFLAPTPGNGESTDKESAQLNEISLEFVAAWRFLSPLLEDAVISRHLESEWPGFVSELKDAFIALVVDGPFPYSLSGHSKGWRVAFYNFGVRERSRPLDRDNTNPN